MRPSGACAVVFAFDISLPWQLNWIYGIKLCWDAQTRTGGKVRDNKKSSVVKHLESEFVSGVA